MKFYKIIISAVALSLLLLSAACEREPKIEYIEISGISVESDAEELDLRGKNISDISGLYSLDNLTSIDLRDNPVSTDDITEFMKAHPDCDVLWSVPVGNLTFDSSAEAISFAGLDKLTAKDVANVLGYFKALNMAEMSSLNISSDDYIKLQAEYPDINFSIAIPGWGLSFDGGSSAIDISECINPDEDTLPENLEYFNKLNTVLFGEILISNEAKDALLQKYPDVNFEWNNVLLDAEYPSSTAEIDISGNIIPDFEAFKAQLKYFNSLTYIDMCDTGLANTQMEELISAYPQTKFVWKIQVGSWEMRTDVTAFGTCYDGEFEGGRYIGGAGFYLDDDEAANLKYCKDLVVLDIGHQYNITNYSFLEGLTNVKYLIVALSNFKDAGLLVNMKGLVYLEIFNTNVSDLSPLMELENLKYLNCSQTLIPDVSYLVDMKQLEVLWLCNSINISRAEAAELEESLPDCYINTTAQGSTRGGWRSYDNQGYVDMRNLLGMYLAFEQE